MDVYGDDSKTNSFGHNIHLLLLIGLLLLANWLIDYFCILMFSVLFKNRFKIMLLYYFINSNDSN